MTAPLTQLQKILIRIGSIALIATGLILCFVVPATVATTYGGTLIIAGIFTILESFSNGATLESCAKCFTNGVCCGFYSATVSLLVHQYSAVLAAKLGFNSVYLLTAFGSINGLFTNAISNFYHGKAWHNNWLMAIVLGGVIGASAQIITVGFNSPDTTAVINKISNLFPKTTIHFLEPVLDIAHRIMSLITASPARGQEVLVCLTELLNIKTLNRPTQSEENSTNRPNPDYFKILDLLVPIKSEEFIEFLKRIFGKRYTELTDTDIEQPTVDLREPTGEISPAIQNAPVAVEADLTREETETEPQTDDQVIVVESPTENQAGPNKPQPGPLHEHLEPRAENHENNVVDTPHSTNTCAPRKNESDPMGVSSIDAKHPDSPNQPISFGFVADDSNQPLIDPSQIITSVSELITFHQKTEELFMTPLKPVANPSKHVITLHTSESRIANPVSTLTPPATPVNGLSINTTKLQSGFKSSPEIGKTFQETNAKAEQKWQSTDSNESFVNTADVSWRKKPAVFKVAAYSEQDQKYYITDFDIWPKLEGDLKIIGVIGVPRSGKTFTLHSALLKMGYELTSQQAVLGTAPIGINAYVLPEDKIIILDCCDTMFYKSEKSGLATAEVNPGGAQMELLTFTSATNILYVTPLFKQNFQETTDVLVNHVKLLTRLTHSFTCINARIIRFLMRTDIHTMDGVSDDIRTLNEDIPTESQADDFFVENSLLSLEALQLKSDINSASKLQFHELKWMETTGTSIKYSEESERELSEMVNFIVSSKSIGYLPEMNLSNLHSYVSQAFAKMDELPKKLADLQNEIIGEQVKQEGMSEIEAFSKEIYAFRKEIAINFQYANLKKELDQYFEKSKADLKEAASLPDDQKSLVLAKHFIEGIVIPSRILVKFFIANQLDLKLTTKGIQLGLKGFLLFSSSVIDDKRFEMLALSASVKEGLIDFLQEWIVHEHYGEAWTLLTLIAQNGFRLQLFQFNFWPFIRNTLAATELTALSRPIYCGVLKFIQELTDSKAPRYLPERLTFWELKRIFLGDKDLAQISFDFERDIHEQIEELCKYLVQHAKDYSERQKTFNERPLEWIKTSTYKTYFSAAPKNMQEKVLDQLTLVNIQTMHRCLAHEIAENVMQLMPHVCTTLFNKEQGNSIMETRLSILSNLAEAASGDKHLLLRLLHPGPILQLIIKELSQETPPPYLSMLLKCCCDLIVAELETNVSSLLPSTSAKSNIVTHSQLQENIRLQNIWKDHSFTCHQLIESGLVPVLIKNFCTKSRTSLEKELYMNILNVLLVSNYGLDVKSADYFTKFRQQICETVVSFLENCVEKLTTPKPPNNSIVYENRGIRISSTLLNKMMYFHYKNQDQKNDPFFKSHGNTSLNNNNIFKRLTQSLRKKFEYSVENFEMDTAENLEMMLMLILNIASTSGISVPNVFVLRKLGLFSEQEHIIKERKVFINTIKNVDVGLEYKRDDRYATIAAHLLTDDKIDSNHATDIIRKVQGELVAEKESQRCRLDWEALQQERIDKLNAPKPVSVDRELLGRRFLGSSSSNDTFTQQPLVDDVFISSSLLSITSKVFDQPDEVLNLIKHKLHEPGQAYANFLLFYNCAIEKTSQFEILCRLLRKVISDKKMIPALNLEKENVIALLQLKHMKFILQELNYELKGNYYKQREDTPYFLVLDDIVLFLTTLMALKNTDELLGRLDSNFSLVRVDNSNPSAATLPEAFFKNIEKSQRKQIQTCTIDTLKQFYRKGKLSRQLAYILIRVKREDKCFQAVFPVSARVEDVINRLKNQFSWGNVQLKCPERLFTKEQLLDAIGFYFIEFVVV